MVPAYVEILDLRLETDEWGEINVDIAFGGVFYAIVDVQQLGLAIEPRQARQLVEAGMRLKQRCIPNNIPSLGAPLRAFSSNASLRFSS